MLLAARIRTALLAVAATISARSAAADEPAPTKEECIAASESGQDLRHTGKLHDARAQFAACVATSCPGPIREDCAQRLDEIAKAMPSIVLEVTDSVGNDLPGVATTMDGQRIASGNGATIELDPGEHVFTFEAPGSPKTGKKLVIVEGDKQRRELVIMAPAERAQIAGTPSAAGEAPTRSARPPTLAWVAFGVGGAGLTLGVIAGLVAGGKHSTLASECDGNTNACAPQYAGDLDSFHTWRTISTVGYVVGALGVAGGAVLWFTAPQEQASTTARVWLGPASAGVSGAF